MPGWCERGTQGRGCGDPRRSSAGSGGGARDGRSGAGGFALAGHPAGGVRSLGCGKPAVGDNATVEENAYMMTLFGFYWITAALGLMNTREGEDAGRSTPQD